jgi:hypothetical protein
MIDYMLRERFWEKYLKNNGYLFLFGSTRVGTQGLTLAE